VSKVQTAQLGYCGRETPGGATAEEEGRGSAVGEEEAIGRARMTPDCPERKRLEHEWNQAVDLASNLEQERDVVVLVEGREETPELLTKIQEAWEWADKAWKSFDIHCNRHRCD